MRKHRAYSKILWGAVALVLGHATAMPASAAGWRARKPLFGGSVDRVTIDAAGTLYISTGGGPLKSTDEGQTWVSALGNLPTTSANVVPDPVEVGVLYAGTDKGLFRSTDGGGTWTRLPLNIPTGTTIQDIAIAPSNTNAIYVSTWGAYVYRSLDRGASWQQRSAGLYGGHGGQFVTSIAVDPTNASRVYTSSWRGRLFRSDDGANSWYQISDSGTWANGQIYVSRSSPNVLYTTHDEYWFGRGTVLRSTDYGNTWTNAGRPSLTSWQGGASDAGSIAIDPTNANVVYVTTSTGVHKTTTGGAPWTRILLPTAPSYGNTVAVAPGNPAKVFAGAASGFFRSSDGGGSWSGPLNTGIASINVSGIEICRDAPNVLYAGATTHGFLKSTDGGLSWSSIGTAAGMASRWIAGLSVNPQNPDVLVASAEPGTWRSTDGGATFNLITSSYGSTFVATNPRQPSNVHMSISDWQGGFLFSSDSGASWRVPYWWYIYPQNYDFHPTLPNVVFSAGNQYTGAPLNTKWILWSNASGGASWTGTSFGQGPWNLVVALDKRDPTILYAATSVQSEGTAGIYKFRVTYSGSSVASVMRMAGTYNNGLATTAIRRLLYDGVTGTLYASTADGVFRSRDQAATWESISAGLPYRSTSEMAVSPDGQRLFVGTSAGIWEYSELIDPEPPIPTIATTPADLLQKVVAGASHTMTVRGESALATDSVEVSMTSTPAVGMSFVPATGNPADATFTFSPGGNQLGEVHAAVFRATSRADASKIAEVKRYMVVIGDSGSDTATLISTNTAGRLTTPDNVLTVDIPGGAVSSADGVASVSLISLKKTPEASVYVQPPSGGKGKAKALAIYDVSINGLAHYTFQKPVALTFTLPAGTDPTQVTIMTYDESLAAYVPRTDTSCLAAFGRVSYTATTVSVCTPTVSQWAVVDMSTFVSDNTPPTVSLQLTPTPNAHGWNNTDAVAQVQATDEEGGSGVEHIGYEVVVSSTVVSSGQVAGASASIPLTVEGRLTFRYWARDAAGNTSPVQSRDVSIDKTAPQLAIGGVQDGGTYLLGCPPSPTFSATDALSGVASSGGTSTGGNGNGVGGFTYRATAIDHAGNTAVVEMSYSIVYGFGGLLPPVGSDGASLFKLGRTVPVKFRLSTCQAMLVSTAVARLSVYKVSDLVTGTREELDVTASGDSNTDDLFRYSAVDDVYIYNLSTKPYTDGTHVLQVTLDDGRSHSTVVSFKSN